MAIPSLTEIKREIERRQCEKSLADFFAHAWSEFDPAPYVDGWHIHAVAEHLEAVASGEIRKLVINEPPRHSKSLLVSVAFPVWLWSQEPDPEYPLVGPQVKFLCLSFSEQLALDLSTLSRRLVQSDWYRERWGDRVQIASDQDNKSKYDTTAGGTRISSSFGGTITGRGGDIRIIDDPHKMDEVESDVSRAGVIRQYNTVIRSRITDPRHTAEVLVAQRGHEGDLTAELLADPDTVHLMLPAEYDSLRKCVTVLGWEDPRTEEGEILWPQRFDVGSLAAFKRQPYEWQSQWQQAPRPRGGHILNPAWWCLFGAEQAAAEGLQWDDGNKEFPTMSLRIASLDTAYTADKSNDFSALTIWGVWRNKHNVQKLMLMYAWAERLELHQLVNKVAETCDRYHVGRLLIENTAAGKPADQELRRLYARKTWGVELINTGRLDKVARAHSVVHLFTEGMIFAPDTAWAQDIINECASFPHGAHDDRVDSVVMALKWLRERGIAQRTDEADAAIVDLMSYKSRGQGGAIYPGAG